MKSYKTKNMNLQLFAENEITDLTGTSWEFVASPDFYYLFDIADSFDLAFISNNHTFVGFTLRHAAIDFDVFYVDIFSDTQVINSGIWTDNSYRTISITGGTDATNTDLINWLQSNATQIQTGYSSTINLTNCTCNKSNETGLSGNYTATVTANSGYYLSSVTSTLGTATISTDKHTATIEISDVNADFTISATGTAKTTQNVILHPDNNGVTDYATDLLPKAQSDASKQNALTTTSVSDGTISKNIGFDSQGNIVKETPSSGGSSTWGSITGTLSNQTDLYNALAGKQDTINVSHKVSADYISDGTNNKVFTATEQTKLSNIESGAEVNDITDVEVNGTSVVTNKVANVTVPTIVANPTLAGTESDLTGLDIDGTKYKVPSGGSAGVSSLGGATGDITLGTGLNIVNNVLSASGGSGALAYDLLWTNPNPSQTFNRQSVTPTNLNNYELINIVFVDTKNELTSFHNVILSKNSRLAMSQGWWDTNINASITRLRFATFKADGTVSFSGAFYWYNGGSSSTTQQVNDNNVIIPLQIYGIK